MIQRYLPGDRAESTVIGPSGPGAEVVIKRNKGRAVVVGAGVFGVSAATSLAARDYSVELVDPGPLPRPEAASTDISKIVRMDYGRDALLTELMERAVPAWRSWNARWGETLYHEDGFLLLSKAPLRPGGFEHDSLTTLQARGHAVETIDGETLRARFPAWPPAVYTDGYFNPAAGWVESGRVMVRLLEDAVRAGVRVRAGDGWAGFIEGGGRISGIVTSSGARYEGDVVLLAAGAWTPILAPWLSAWMWPVAQPVFHLAPDDPERWRAPEFPVWAAAIAETGWYGFPANAAGLVKIANHGPGRRVHPEAMRTTEPGDLDRLRAFLRESLPGLAEAPLAASKTCLYCDAFDGDFWIGRDPERPGLAVAAGDSGHGFKFAPVLGDVIADAIENKTSKFTQRFAWRTPPARKSEPARFLGTGTGTCPQLRCTVRGCGDPLTLADDKLVCPRGHAFDRAREGYWNLAQPQDRRSTRAGDRDAAVLARRRWLARGFADGLAEELSRRIDALPRNANGTAIDVGCGEGTLTARLLGSRAEDACGVDLSTSAIRLAAKAAPSLTWIVANADRGLPFLDGSVSLALSIFGRRPAAELRRVLAANGTLIVAVPGDDDLLELREAAQGKGIRRDRVADVMAELEGQFELASRSAWRHPARHDRAAWEDALAMSYRGARARERERLDAIVELDVTLSAEILALVPRGGLR
jgi:sarcosine oxidase / L-pipecolate oxidase